MFDPKFALRRPKLERELSFCCSLVSLCCSRSMAFWLRVVGFSRKWQRRLGETHFSGLAGCALDWFLKLSCSSLLCFATELLANAGLEDRWWAKDSWAHILITLSSPVLVSVF